MQVFGKEGASRTMLAAAVAHLASNTIVCWGSQHHPEWGKALNNCPRLNAVEQLQRMQAAGVPTVDYTTSLADAVRWVREGALVFGRRLRHSQGTDIISSTGPHARWRRREYWTKVVPNVAQEWRIHVFRGHSIARGLKVQVGPSRRPLPIRNRRNGWHMIHTTEPTDALRDVAKQAVKALGYDFGAVDVLVDTAGRHYVLECNRAPGLDDYTCGQYVAALTKFAAKEARA